MDSRGGGKLVIVEKMVEVSVERVVTQKVLTPYPRHLTRIP